MLFDKLKNRRIILASNSPRRRELMADAGFDFEVAPKYEVVECFPSGMSAGKVATYLSRLKSKSFPRRLEPNEILITADTIVVVGDEILGKPIDRNDAIRMLTTLSGRSHKVITGVTIRTDKRIKSFAGHSTVRFNKLSAEEINYYVNNYSPMDKAGAYGIQEWIGYIGIKGISGSFYNVMGLPIQQLYCELDKFVTEV